MYPMNTQTISHFITVLIGLLAIIGILSLLKAPLAVISSIVFLSLFALLIMKKVIVDKKTRTMKKAKKIGMTVHHTKSSILRPPIKPSTAKLTLITGKKQAK